MKEKNGHTDFLFILWGILELVVCPNTNDAQIYEHGQSNWNLEATLKGVSSFRRKKTDDSNHLSVA
jgi:hypothetical protein